MYKRLEKLECVVVGPLNRPNCYEVRIKRDSRHAELVCCESLTPGEEVVGLFGDESDGHILLAADGDWLSQRRSHMTDHAAEIE